MRLAGRCPDVLEVRVIMQDNRTVMFRDGCSEQVNHSSCPVMTADRHPDLDIAGAISDRLTDRQDNIQLFAAAGDFPDIR
jgi:hypothetical protein